MTRCNSPHRLPFTPVPAWPTPLRAEWAQLTSPVQDLFAPRAGDWATATFRQAEQGLGKLVSHIRASGPIDDTVGILGLVSEPALQGFVAGIIRRVSRPARKRAT